MSDLTAEQKTALEHARYLAEMGAPIFVARPHIKDGKWVQKGGHNGSGYWFPEHWQQLEPDPSIVDEWRPGMALGLVSGTLVDVIDVDPRNGGELTSLNGTMPVSYGQQTTPSGGTHDLIAPLGVRKGSPLPGIDLQAGDASGKGRGFVFLAPTVKPSKVTGELATYMWVAAPDVGPLLLEEDASGAALAELMRSKKAEQDEPFEYDGPSYAELKPALQEMADKYVADEVEKWWSRFEAALKWKEGDRDEKDRGWELLAKDWAWALAKMTAAPWTALDSDSARVLHDEILPQEFADDPVCAGKWGRSLVKKAGEGGVDAPPWAGLDTPVDDDEEDDMRRNLKPVDVTNHAASLGWIEKEVGQGPLAGVFRRGQELVHTPRIGEDGYVPPKSDRDSAGPAQVRRIDALELARRIDYGYVVTKTVLDKKGKPRTTPCLFPQAVASRATAAPDLLRNTRELVGVTHTPVVRKDGTILDTPGYDDDARMLYLPDPSLTIPEVAQEPSREDVERAGKLLMYMVAEFPFVTTHDRANYFGMLLTPLLRPLVPPPYKVVVIGAPQRGSGKSLLAKNARELHGGVFKSEFPTNDDELRKFITSTLDGTTGPVVQFDNVTGVLKSSVLDGLLTSDEWADRRLGVNEMVSLPNDRLWVVTGNNVHIGGDLERRTLWVTINARVERPEELTFTITDLEGWVRERRGELLWALLTLIRSWVVAGSRKPENPTSDSYGYWVAVVRGIIAHADLGETVGVFGHEESKQAKADPEEEEWAGFLAAAHRVFGSEPWTVKQLLANVWEGDGVSFTDEEAADWVMASDLPGDIADRRMRSSEGAAKSLGKWLGFRNERWAHGLSVQHVGESRGSKLWRIVEASEPA